jgi:hypothetical protein
MFQLTASGTVLTQNNGRPEIILIEGGMNIVWGKKKLLGSTSLKPNLYF